MKNQKILMAQNHWLFQTNVINFLNTKEIFFQLIFSMKKTSLSKHSSRWKEPNPYFNINYDLE